MLRQRGSATLHYLDRYCGIPAIAILGLFKRKRKLPRQIGSIGLLRLAGIGDTVLISAAATDLRIAFPRASLTFFAGPTNFDFVQMLNGLDRAIKVPVRNVDGGIRAIRSIPLDVMIDFGPWPRLEALYTLLSTASFTIGFRTPGQYRHFGYDLTVDHLSDVHELENFRRLVRLLGANTGSLPFLRRPQMETCHRAPYVVFHLWPGGRRRKLKQWPSERWVRLIEDLAARETYVLLTGADSDYGSNDAIVERVQPRARGLVRNVAGVSLQETAAILAAARLVVSVDTGVMHMAAALGAPLVALFGPSSSRRWGPASAAAVAIDSPLAGCGYVSLGWERVSPAPRCMECLLYETVRDACLAVLKKEPVNPHLGSPAKSFEEVASEVQR
jgi:ADP-heptose:LPS heptosyltransferase